MPDIKDTGIYLDFGIFDSTEWSEDSAAEIYERRLEMAEFADKNDFFCYHVVEHHTTPLCIAPSPSVMLSAIAQRTTRIRIGPLGFLLPFHNPLRLYHEICMLDHMSQGRLELGFGRGIVPIEAERFGIMDVEKGREMMLEALDVLLAGFNNDILDFKGEYYSYSNIKLWQKPYQKPYPPLWYPTANINSIPWAAESGLNVCGIIETAEEYRELFDLYKKIWSDNRGQSDRINGHVENPKIGLARNVYVAQTDREAINDARSAHEVWRKHIGFLFDEAGITIPPLERLSKFDELMDEDVFLVGSPTTVTEQIERTVEQSGINYLNCLFAFGNLNHERVMRSMRLFTQEVIPAFKGGGDGPSQIL